jgi:hypothetical protein
MLNLFLQLFFILLLLLLILFAEVFLELSLFFFHLLSRFLVGFILFTVLDLENLIHGKVPVDLSIVILDLIIVVVLNGERLLPHFILIALL